MPGQRSKIVIGVFFLIMISSGIYLKRNPYWVGFYPACNQFIKPLKALNCLEKEKCFIDFNEIYKFNWDYFYILNGEATKEEISNHVKAKYKGRIIREDNTVFVFVKNGKVVETKYTFICPQNYWFKDEKGWITIPKENSKFQVKYHELNGIISYELIGMEINP